MPISAFGNLVETLINPGAVVLKCNGCRMKIRVESKEGVVGSSCGHDGQ